MVDAGESYLPVGELPYVMRRRWGNVISGPVLVTGSVGLWAGGVLDPTFSAFVAIFGVILTVLLVAGTIRSGDDDGIIFAVDEEGVYFGDAPRERIPWSMVATVVMSRSEPQGDHDSGRTFWVRVAEPGEEVGRIRHGDFLPLFDEISAALDRHAPPHVLVRRDYDRP